MTRSNTPQWQRVCTVDDIPVQGSRVLQRNGQDNIAIFRTTHNGIFALVDRCPHKGGPLSAGLVYGNAVSCPLHNWVIQLDNGRAQSPDEGCVMTVPVKLDAGIVYLGLE